LLIEKKMRCFDNTTRRAKKLSSDLKRATAKRIDSSPLDDKVKTRDGALKVAALQLHRTCIELLGMFRTESRKMGGNWCGQTRHRQC
jgi:hypothetical protein